jgi:uncharacterized membrane protein
VDSPHGFFSFVKQHKGAIIGVSLGLLIGILMLTIGFFATLFLAFCAGVGALFGTQNRFRKRFLEILDKILPDIFK